VDPRRFQDRSVWIQGGFRIGVCVDPRRFQDMSMWVQGGFRIGVCGFKEVSG
jgi:hypothetical protein